MASAALHKQHCTEPWLRTWCEADCTCLSAGVLGGTVGLALLAAALTCIGSRLYANRVRRRFPPASGNNTKVDAKQSDTPTSMETGESDSMTPQVALHKPKFFSRQEEVKSGRIFIRSCPGKHFCWSLTCLDRSALS